MDDAERNALIALPIIIVVGILLALAGSYETGSAFGLSLFAIGVIIAFVIQWLVFIPSYFMQTERFFDLTGSITYLIVVWFTFSMAGTNDTRSLLLTVFVSIWAVRLGSFLYTRIRKAGEDSRFDNIKTSGIRFFMAWTLQGLWVSFTLAATIAALSTSAPKAFDVFVIIGVIIWAIGFALEVIADEQKRRFRSYPDNKGKFIQSGVWAWSRHPNYFGEIVLWIGMAIIAFPVLQGWQYFTLISPIFVFFLLTKVSGIPMLEESADKKWGGQEDYETYKENTPVLIPKPPRKVT